MHFTDDKLSKTLVFRWPEETAFVNSPLMPKLDPWKVATAANARCPFLCLSYRSLPCIWLGDAGNG